MKRRKIILRIHLCLCLFFAVIWGICIALSKNGLIYFDNPAFQGIGFLLSVSYLLDFCTAKKKDR